MQPVSCAGCQALQRRLRDLQAENERLRRQLDETTRAGKRQAAPFAKGQPAALPKKPGRKPGKDYGTKAHRQPPTPEQIDEVHEAPLPSVCPDCGGPLDETHVAQDAINRFGPIIYDVRFLSLEPVYSRRAASHFLLNATQQV